jgi:hypothetical protein
MHNNKRSALVGVLAISWILATSIGYIYIHKPFSPENLLAWLVYFWQILVALGITVISGGIGTALIPQRKLDTNPITLAVLQVSLGFALLSVSVLLVGSIIGVSRPLFLLLLLATSLVLRKKIVIWIKTWVNLKLYWPPDDIFSRSVAVLIIIIVTLKFLTALAPPTAFDALTYHLSIPETYILNGKISYISSNIYWGMPEITEMLYTLAILFAHAESATVLGWIIGILTTVGVLSFTSERFDIRSGWVAVASLLVSWTLADALAWGYVDWTVMLYGWAFLVTIELWRNNKNSLLLYLSAGYTGMAFGAKYTAGLLGLAGVIIILLEVRKLGTKTTLLNIFKYAAIALICASPWLIKNSIATGNPFYPLLFPAGEMDALHLFNYQYSPANTNWFRLLILPWEATVWGMEGKIGYSASIGPILLGFSLLAYFDWKQKDRRQANTILTCGLIVITGLLVWAIGSQFAGLLIQTRLYFVIFPSWAILAGAGYYSISKIEAYQVRFGRLGAIFITLFLLFTTYESISSFENRNVLQLITGTIDTQQYIKRNMGSYAMAMDRINNLPETSKVLMLWETRDFYCLERCDPDEIIDQWYHDWRTLKDSEAIIKSWQELGYTHILYYKTGANFIRETEKLKYVLDDWEGLDKTFSKLPAPEIIGNSYWLIDLTAYQP